MPKSQLRTKLFVAVSAALCATPTLVQASAFALLEQNASGLGNAYAGAAAVAEDASTIFFNPAGLGMLSGRQVVVGGSLIKPTVKFNDGGSLRSGSGLPPAPINTSAGATLRPLGGNGGDAGDFSLVPNLYFAMDLTPQWKIGIGLNVPFGLKTEYDADWAGRFQAIKSEVRTYNLNPTVAYKVNDTVSFGAGLNYQHIDAEFSNAVNYAGATWAGIAAVGGVAAANAATPLVTTPEGTVTLKGNDSSWGYNVGALVKLAPQTQLGIAYRSAIKYHITGTASFEGAPTSALLPASVRANFAGGGIYADIKMPDSLSVALSHQVNDRWRVSGDVSWTGWSKIQTLAFYRDNGSLLGSTPENFRNTLRVGVGATYRMNDAWTFRGGVAFDQTPVNDTDRTARLPDGDRTWVSVGGQYSASPALKVDFGYTHIFVKNASINQTQSNATGGTPATGLLYGQLLGSYKASVDIVGAQLTYKF